MKKIIVILLLILIPLAIAAAANTVVIDLDTALKTAEENSPELLKAELSLKSALRTHETSWNSFLPTINLSGSFSGADALLSESSGTISPWSVSGGISMSLQLSPSAAFAIEADRIAYELEQLSYNQTRTNLLANVEKTYYALLTEKSDLEIDAANLELALKRWEQSKNNFSYGLVSELSVLQAEVSAANLKPSYNQAIQNYESSKQSFLMLIGLPADTQIMLDGELPDYPSDIFLNTAFFIKNNIPGRFDIRTLQLNKESLENTKNYTAAAGRSPYLGLSAGYTDTLSNILTNSDSIFTDRASLSLSLTIPVDDWIPGSSTDTSVKNYEDSIQQMDISISTLSETAETEVLNLVSTIYTLQETIELSELSLKLAKRSYEMTEESFSKGRIERLNVEDSQQSMRQAEQQLLLAKSNLISRLIDLRLALNIDSTEKLLENN